MAAGWVGMVTAALTLLASVLGWLARNKEVRDAHQDERNIQAERKALADNDGTTVDAVCADQHDRVLAALGGSEWRGSGDGEEEHH